MSNLCLPDLYYSAYLNENFDFIKKLKHLKKENKKALNLYFDNKFRQKLAKFLSIKVPEINENELKKISTHFYLTCKQNYYETSYITERNLTKDTTDYFNIGVFSSDSFDYSKFSSEIYEKFEEQSVVYFLNYILFIVANSIKDEEYELLVIPSVDKNNISQGLVFRNLKYTPREKGIRNLFKFFITNPYSYIFNYKDIEEYDNFYIVEGVFDKMFLYECGIKNCLSFSANRMSQYHFEILKDKKLNIIFDNDLGGLSGCLSIKKLNPYNNINSFNLTPNENIDIDEMSKEEVISFIKTIK